MSQIDIEEILNQLPFLFFVVNEKFELLYEDIITKKYFKRKDIINIAKGVVDGLKGCLKSQKKLLCSIEKSYFTVEKRVHIKWYVNYKEEDYIFSGFDITDKVESEEKFRLLVEFSGNLIYWVTPEKKLKYISPNCKEITGYEDIEFYNDPNLLVKIVYPEDIEKIDEHNRGRKVTEDDRSHIEFRIVRKDGKIRWMKHFCKPIFDKNGNFLGRRGANQDITEYKNLHDKMINTQKVEILGKVAGGVVHDFNNILAAISGHTDLALRTIPENSKAAKYLKNIKSSVKKGESITSKLLSFSKSKIKEKKYFELSKIISEFFPVLRRLIGEDIKLEVLLNYKGVIYGDPSDIEQIVMNLVLNSRDAVREIEIYESERKKIFLKTEAVFVENEIVDSTGRKVKRGKYALISVKDNGIGIKKEFLAKIFEPFYSTKNTGTGLGLFIVSSVVKDNKGYIFIESKEMEGTEIKVLLPEVEAEELGEVEEKEEYIEEERLLFKGKKVLFVEDEPDVRDFVVQALNLLGCEVLSAGNGHEALKILESMDFDVNILITDVVMPIMTGEELVKIVRKKAPSIKIILSSGYTNGYINMKDRKEFDLFLKKPYSIDDLKSAIFHLLK